MQFTTISDPEKKWDTIIDSLKGYDIRFLNPQTGQLQRADGLGDVTSLNTKGSDVIEGK